MLVWFLSKFDQEPVTYHLSSILAHLWQVQENIFQHFLTTNNKNHKSKCQKWMTQELSGTFYGLVGLLHGIPSSCLIERFLSLLDLTKKMLTSRARQLSERARGASEAFEMQLRCQHCSLTCVIWGSTLGKQQSPQTPSASLDCLIAELIQPVHLHRDHLNRLFIKASSPVLPASESNNQTQSGCPAVHNHTQHAPPLLLLS